MGWAFGGDFLDVGRGVIIAMLDLRLLFRFGLVLCFSFTSALADMVLVVNGQSGVAVMTKGDVANLYLGRLKTFFNGLPVSLADLEDVRPERGRFYQSLLEMDLNRLEAHRARQRFSGQAPTFKLFRSPDDLLTWVAATPGAIGYIDARDADARVRVVLQLREYP